MEASLKERPALSVGSVRVGFGRRAGACEVAVAVNVVDPGNGRPILVLARCGQREERLFLRIRAVPGRRNEEVRGVRRVGQYAVLP